MVALCLDISSDEGLFALFFDGSVIEEVLVPLRPRSGTKEQPYSCQQPTYIWQQLLDRHHLALSDVAYLACGVGPGSYMGIRSAAATAKGVAFAMNMPIVALYSPLFFVPPEPGTYLVGTSAGASGIYVQRIAVGETIVAEQPVISNSFGSLAAGETAVVPEGFSALDIADVRRVRKNSYVAAKAAFQEYILFKSAPEGQSASVYSAKELPLRYLRRTQAEINLYG